MDSEDRDRSRGEEIPLVPGKVYLVGAGPGDPSLLTLRAADLLRAADVVILDSLVSSEIAARIGSHARVIDAGKRSGREERPQEEIHRMLVEEGKKGKVVVRLKGGDPFVFGRGGEEAEALRAEGIPFEIVPGISSAIAAPAYAGIPVTHRALAASVTFITGRGERLDEISWEALAKLEGTLVFLMGLETLEAIVTRLLDHGLAADTPVAVVSQATTRRQRTVTGSVASIVAAVREAAVEPPAIVVVGQVVRLQSSIAWFESKPLFGRTVVVTRARSQAAGLARLLESEGASVVHFPMIEIGPPESWASLDAVIERAATYAWIIFTSANGVEAFFERLRHHGRDVRSLAAARIAAVGEATAGALHGHGIVPDLVPEKYQSSALAEHFQGHLEGARFAVVRAAAGRDELLDELRSRGATVDLGVAYETKPTRALRDQIGSMLGAGRLDAITFTSSSTVDNFFEQLSEDERKRVIENVSLASIGPVTSQTLRAHGAEPAIEAGEATVQALVQALVAFFRSRS
ncbi:MAG: uroporphyrinogen-III C-methyltransferase [Thermoanaerobaculia bacterium]